MNDAIRDFYVGMFSKDNFKSHVEQYDSDVIILEEFYPTDQTIRWSTTEYNFMLGRFDHINTDTISDWGHDEGRVLKRLDELDAKAG